MNWISLEHSSQLEEILQTPKENGKLDLIFKHSTRCPISTMAINRLERSWDLDDDINAYYLDLIRYRNLSNKVAEKLNLMHESPQLILLEKTELIYHASHNAISLESLKDHLAQYMHNK